MWFIWAVAWFSIEPFANATLVMRLRDFRDIECMWTQRSCVGHLARRSALAAMMLEETLASVAPPPPPPAAVQSNSAVGRWATMLQLVQRCASNMDRSVRDSASGRGFGEAYPRAPGHPAESTAGREVALQALVAEVVGACALPRSVMPTGSDVVDRSQRTAGGVMVQVLSGSSDPLSVVARVRRAREGPPRALVVSLSTRNATAAVVPAGCVLRVGCSAALALSADPVAAPAPVLPLPSLPPHATVTREIHLTVSAFADCQMHLHVLFPVPATGAFPLREFFRVSQPLRP